MEWTQFVIMFFGMFGLFAWNRVESRSDIRHMDNKMDAIRELTHAIHLEMKDFHHRLEKQDADFKNHMEKQDAEFKAHMLKRHSVE